MALSELSENDRKNIFQCLNAISKGNFLEYEYQERLGIELEELNEIVADYPNIDDSHNESNETLAINNCLNEVCYGIGFSDEEWKQWFDVNKSEIEEVFRKWVRFRGWSETRIR